MVFKTIEKKRVATCFGVALSSLFVASEINADIETTTFNGGQEQFSVSFYSFSGFLAVDQIGTGIQFSFFNSFGALDPYGNSSSSMCPIREIFGNPTHIEKFRLFETGETISPDKFSGGGFIDFSTAAANLSTNVGFQTASGNVGWFKLGWETFEVEVEPGQIGTMGEAVLAGQLLGDVDENGSVNLLDVGPFVDLLASGNFATSADMNIDGSVNLLDVQKFVDALAN